MALRSCVWSVPQSTYRGRGEIGGMYLPSQLERTQQLCSWWSKGGGRAPQPHQARLILPSWWNIRQKVTIASLWYVPWSFVSTAWVPPPPPLPSPPPPPPHLIASASTKPNRKNRIMKDCERTHNWLFNSLLLPVECKQTKAGGGGGGWFHFNYSAIKAAEVLYFQIRSAFWTGGGGGGGGGRRLRR